MSTLLRITAGAALLVLSPQVHAAPTAKTAPSVKKGGVHKTSPTKSAPKPNSAAKPKTSAKPDATVHTGVVRKATGMPRLRADQVLTRSHAARVLGVAEGSLSTKVVLSPAQPKSGASHMRFYCPTVVDPSESRARFEPGEFGGCSYRTGVGLRFEATAGKRYLIDCVGTPGTNVTWGLHRSGNPQASHTAANTEHPAFVYEASTTGEVALDLNASASVFFVHRCEITPTN